MKTKCFNILILLLTLSTGLFANEKVPGNLKGRYTKEKSIQKEFNVNADALLKINNSYGNVNVTSWNENRVVIKVVIKTNGNDEEKVAQKLEEITVNFTSKQDLVTAETFFERQNRSWWSSLMGNDNINMEINYTIQVPVTNRVDLNNDYGGIYLDRIEGQAKIACDYGRIQLGELMGDNNSLSFDYTNNSSIGYMKSGRISADYSSFTLEKAENVELSADYTKSNFGDVRNLDFSCDYGNLTVDKLINIKGNGDYLSLRLGSVGGAVDLSSDYGSIKIDKMEASAGNLNISTDYAGIEVGYDQGYQFQFEIQLEYANLQGENALEMITQRIESSDKYFKGYYGNANAKNQLRISSEYGGVNLIKK